MLPRLLWDDTLTITCEVAVTSSFISLVIARKEASRSGSAHATHVKRRALSRILIDSSDEEEAPQPPKAKRSKLESSTRPERPAAGDNISDKSDDFADKYDDEEGASAIFRKKGEAKVLILVKR
jgi:SET domain-containing protein